MKITYTTPKAFTQYQQVVITKALREVTQGRVDLERVSQGGKGILGFGVESEYSTLSPQYISQLPTAERILAKDFRDYFGIPQPPRKTPVPNDAKTLYFDIESHSVDDRWNMHPDEFFRLGQYAWGIEGEVVLTVDRAEMLEQIRKADLVVGHNIHSFDLSVLFGTDSTEPLEMARDGKVLDTYIFAQMALPAPAFYMTRNGKRAKATKPEEMKKWYSLDNIAFQLDVTGKIGDLSAMAKKYGGFGNIPLVLTEFIEYARQDIVALQEITHELLCLKDLDDYDWREQTFAGICAQIARNGFKVDIEKATARRGELEYRKQELLSRLVAEYDFPTEGKKPWVSKKGKEALFKILADNGITEETVPDWPRTDTGNLSLGGKVLIEITEGTAVEQMGQQLAELAGQRSLSQLALDSVQDDGKVHPDINFLQRSGRSCVPDTHKLLTRRGLKHIDDVRIGDETLDMRNRWVKVTNIYRYQDQEVNRYSNKSTELEATTEHRWVQTTESGGRFTRKVEPMRPRSVIQLTPDSCPFDRNDHFFPQGMTHREIVAALVGLFVTDGRATIRTDSENAATFHVYQTEGKFYRQFRELIPAEWVASDTSRMTGLVTTPIHDIRLKSAVIRPLLEEMGLDLTNGLRNSDTLFPWLLTLSQQETLAFLTAVYPSDGTVSAGGTTIATRNPNLVPVFQLAAYRSGYRSNYRKYKNKRDSYESGRVSLVRDGVHTRNLSREVFRSDVWCVETETGTFTAWYKDGAFSAPYLTGNSVQKPGLTVWSSNGEKSIEKSYFVPDSDDELLVEMDYSNADGRIVAAYSGDDVFLERMEDSFDSHEMSGRLLFGDKLYDTNPKFYRQESKAASHGWAYRAGVGAVMRGTKTAYEQAKNFIDGMNDRYKDVLKWQNRMSRKGESGRLTNDWGRVMIVESDRSFTQSPALMGQSGTREIMVDALNRMLNYDVMFITWIKVTVHDAIVYSIPKKYIPWGVDKCRELMETSWQPSDGTGQLIEFPVSAGTPSTDWQKAGH